MTRYDMAQLMANVMAREGKTVSEADKQAAQVAIADWNSIPESYKSAVSECFSLGIISGFSDGTFGGEKVILRSHAAVTLNRLWDAIHAGDTGEAEPVAPVEPDEPEPDTTARPSDAIGEKYDLSVFNVPADTNKDGYLTEAEVMAVFERLEREYPEGTAWRDDKSYYSPSMGSATACAAWAYYCSDQIFGNLPRYTIYSVYDLWPQSRKL